jgi:molecular chaperone DnaK (HSP70)
MDMHIHRENSRKSKLSAFDALCNHELASSHLEVTGPRPAGKTMITAKVSRDEKAILMVLASDPPSDVRTSITINSTELRFSSDELKTAVDRSSGKYDVSKSNTNTALRILQSTFDSLGRNSNEKDEISKRKLTEMKKELKNYISLTIRNCDLFDLI